MNYDNQNIIFSPLILYLLNKPTSLNIINNNNINLIYPFVYPIWV